MTWPGSGALTGPLFSTEAMAAVFSDAARLQAMLDAEASLADAEADCGIIPQAVVGAIRAACRAELYDREALGRAAVDGGNLAIPLIKALTAKAAESSPQAANWVHWGATSQDIVDTGLVLQIRAALNLIRDDLAALCDALAALAEAHAEAPIAGRTLMQQAVPTTLGLKAAGWLSGVMHAGERLRGAGEAACVLQLGGAAGTLAALGEDGPAVATALARRLGLAASGLPWHSQRGGIADLGCALAILTGAAGKFARDLALMAQTEVGEFAEPAGDGKGGSSAMPHKANPVGCVRILAAARRAPGLAATLLAAMDQEHERALGGWHAEWETLPELFRLASMAVAQAAGLAAHGLFDTARMRANLDATGGLIMAEAVTVALAPRIGRQAARAVLDRAIRRVRDERLAFAEALAAEPELAAHIDAAALGELLRPKAYLGAAPEMARKASCDYYAYKKQQVA